MEKTYERLEDNKVKFEVTIPAADVDEAIDSVYQEVNRSARIPGFRKGKAPRAVLDSNFGAEYFTSRATGDLITATAEKAVDESNMVSLTDYDFGDAEIMAAKGADLVYSFTIEVLPELELSSYEPVEVTASPIAATAEEIDAQIDVLRSYYIELKDVERPVEDDDIVQYSIRCELNGEQLEAGTSESKTIVVGGGTKPTLDKEFIGAEIGVEKKITAPSAEFGIEADYPDTDIDGFITVTAIHAKTQPELTDEWVQKTCEYKTVDELRATIADSITSQKQMRYENDLQVDCLDELAKRLEGEPTQAYINECNSTVLRNFYNGLQAQGVTLDQYIDGMGQTPEDFYKDLEEQGLLLAKQNIALDAIIRKEGWSADEDAIRESLEAAGIDDIDEVIKSWKDENRLSELRANILRDKAAKFVRENAIINSAKADDEAEAPAEDAE